MNRILIFKNTYYILLFFIITLLQTSVLPKLFSIAPLWLHMLVVIISMREGEKFGFFYGLAAGIICDSVMYPAEVYFTLALAGAGFVIGYFVERTLDKNFFVALTGAAVLIITSEVLYFLFFYYFPGRAGFSALMNIIAPELGLSVLTFPVIYLLALPVSAMGRKGRALTWKVRN